MVGGSVRDLLLGVPTGDFDFTTNATPEQIQKYFLILFMKMLSEQLGLTLKMTKFLKSQHFAANRVIQTEDILTWLFGEKL